MYCANCGKEIADDTKFCPNCGTAVVMDAELKEKVTEKPEETKGPITTEKVDLTKTDKAGIGIIGIVVIVGIVVMIAVFAIAVVKSMTNSGQSDQNEAEVVEETEAEPEIPNTWEAVQIKDDFGDAIDGQYELTASFPASETEGEREDDDMTVDVSIVESEDFGPMLSAHFRDNSNDTSPGFFFHTYSDDPFSFQVKAGDKKYNFGLVGLDDDKYLYLLDFDHYIKKGIEKELEEMGASKEAIADSEDYINALMEEAQNKLGEDYDKTKDSLNIKRFLKLLYDNNNDLECVLTTQIAKYKFTIKNDNFKDAFDSTWDYKEFMAPLKGKKNSKTTKEKISDNNDASSEDFIYKAVYEKKLDDSDLEAISQLAVEGLPTGKTASQMIINEIYARHGYIFSNDEINEFFKKRSWYNGVSSNDGEVTSQFSQTEKDNIVILREGSTSSSAASALDSSSGIDWNQIAEDSQYSLEQLGELKLATVNYISTQYGTDWETVSESAFVDKFANVLYTVVIKDSSGNEHSIDGSYDENGQPYFYTF